MINEIAREYYRKQIDAGSSIDLTSCPEPVTKKMLLDELMTGDLSSYINKVDKEYLWNIYLYINTVSTNKFGFVNSPFYKVQPWQRYLYSKKFSTNQLGSPRLSSTQYKRNSTIKRAPNKYYVKLRGNSKKTNLKSKTYRDPTPYRANVYRKRRPITYSSRIVYGGGNQERMRTIVDCLNNGIYPHWKSRFSTIVKISDINNKPIYVRGTSLPVSDNPSTIVSVCNGEDFCTNTLNFYRYIKNIPNLISLQGCDLDWTGYRYTPKHCDDLNEKEKWNRICNEYDNVTEPSHMRNDHMKEFHWVDMSAGFFSVYDSLSNIDFTDISNSSIIHCLAGFGRTGTVLMLIICINYYKDFPSKYEADFLTLEQDDPDNSKTSNRIIRKLKWLFYQFVEVDQEIPIDPEISINGQTIDRIKRSITLFDANTIQEEIFTNFYRRGSRNNQINFTSLNVLVTRINYILYFTAKACGLDRLVLYGTHEHKPTPVNNPLIMDSLVLTRREEISLINVNVHVKNPVVQQMAITELSNRGFDFVFFNRVSRDNGSSARRSSRRIRNGSRNNTTSLIMTDLAPIERLASQTLSKTNKTKCVIS
jgi:hypothetical protein